MGRVDFRIRLKLPQEVIQDDLAAVVQLVEIFLKTAQSCLFACSFTYLSYSPYPKTNSGTINLNFHNILSSLTNSRKIQKSFRFFDSVSLGAFNNYLEAVKKCLILGIKTVHVGGGGGGKKWQNSVHVVIERPLSSK